MALGGADPSLHTAPIQWTPLGAPRSFYYVTLTSATIGEWPPAPGSWDLLVNATPVGTAPNDASPLPPDHVFDGRLVYDLVYNPPQTRLLRDAANAGCRTIGGLDMLVAQAQAQFEWWTHQRPVARVMRDAAVARLGLMEKQ